ncbi:MAG: site-2 protease family protein [Thermoleophilia bacterium]|nr:site-2 protease family protein [Thermoleophilia bacterium]
MSRDILDLVYLLPILLVSMMAHEVSHGYVAFRLGDPTAKAHGRLTLNPLKHLDPLGKGMFVLTYLLGGFVFGWAKPVPVSPYYFKDSQRGMLLVGLAGPAANFIMAVGLAVVLNLLHPAVSSTLFTVLFLAFQVNVVLGIFNLVPIPPLDGSRVLGGFLPREAYARWVELDRYGMVFILLILFVFQGPFFDALERAFSLVTRVLLPAYT